jgi:hypothetical protein
VPILAPSGRHHLTGTGYDPGGVVIDRSKALREVAEALAQPVQEVRSVREIGAVKLEYPALDADVRGHTEEGAVAEMVLEMSDVERVSFEESGERGGIASARRTHSVNPPPQLFDRGVHFVFISAQGADFHPKPIPIQRRHDLEKARFDSPPFEISLHDQDRGDRH